METREAPSRPKQQHQDPSNFLSIRESVTQSIRDRLNKLPPLYSDQCIHRVPDRLRKPNQEAFTPRLLSVGPLHFGKPYLKPMEDLKLRFLKRFFSRTDESFAIIDFVVREEDSIRRHYESQIELTSKDFSEMILLDSVFLLELLLKKDEKDPMFENCWLCFDLLHDMLLIENQIPLFVPRTIYDVFLAPFEGKKLFLDLVHAYIKEAGNAPSLVPVPGQGEPRHFVEYLRMAHLPGNEIRATRGERNFDILTPSATDLLETGVKLASNTECSLMEIHFENGVLTIPRLTVNEWTETFFHNLIAFEQLQCNFPKFFSDYVIFMDSLIITSKDVDVLVAEGIIEDTLNDREKIWKLFKNFYKDTFTEGMNFYFAKVSYKLNEYSCTR